jgi:hypothetical protein
MSPASLAMEMEPLRVFWFLASQNQFGNMQEFNGSNMRISYFWETNELKGLKVTGFRYAPMTSFWKVNELKGQKEFKYAPAGSLFGDLNSPSQHFLL